MYISEGIVYGNNGDKNIEIQKVKVLDDKIMIIKFTSGEIRLFDATILKGPAFSKLEDDTVFRNPAIEYGVVTWDDGNIDCAPEYIYEHSYEYVCKEDF